MNIYNKKNLNPTETFSMKLDIVMYYFISQIHKHLIILPPYILRYIVKNVKGCLSHFLLQS